MFEEAAKILDKAKVQAVITHSTHNRPSAFFSSILLRLGVKLDEHVETASTDGKSISINPHNIIDWGVNKTVGVLIHEVMHVAHGHHLRMGHRDPKLWNIACDYAINWLIKAAGYELPDGVLFKKEYEGLSAEEIYEIVKTNLSKAGSDGAGSNGDGGDNSSGGERYFGEVVPPKGEISEEIQKATQDWQNMVNQAAITQKMAGVVPGWLERFIGAVNESKHDWKELLAAWLKDIAGRSDYSWSRPNKRYAPHGLYLPSFTSDKGGSVVFIVDTSGSITQEELNYTAGEAQGLIDATKATLHVVYVDSEVASVDVFEPGEPIELNPMGGGGTDFIPGFEWIEEQGLNPHAVVYFTDGYCHSYPKEPSYPVLWLGTRKFTPPFGEFVLLNRD